MYEKKKKGRGKEKVEETKKRRKGKWGKKEKKNEGQEKKKLTRKKGEKNLRWDLNPGPTEYRALVRRGEQW